MKKFAWLVFVVFSLVFISMLPSGVSALAGGEGSSGTPIQITNCVQLQEMNNNLNASYVLMNDIDCSDTVNWNSGAGFVPIYGFAGIFDGQNHKITGLFINRPLTDYVGLFAYTDRGGIIKNVGLVNVNITGNCYVGLLAGSNYFGAITNSYSTGSVTGVYQVGGLVGWNPGVITNSYSTGSVSGSSYVGGLAGCNSGAITNSYATGRVTCSYAYAGGLVGVNTAYWWDNTNPGFLTNSYWDIETSGMFGSSGGIGKTTAEMKQQATFVDWDFVNIWAIKEGVSYPYFLWQIPPVVAIGMVSYWKFDETSGTTAYDAFGRNNGTVSGATWNSSGKVGGALSFDGVDDYVSVSDSDSLDITNQLTIDLWVKPQTTQSTTYPILVEKSPVNTIYELILDNGGYHAFGKYVFYFDGGTGRVISTTNWNTGQWAHIAVTYDGSYVKMYVNGVLESSTPYTSPILTSTDPLLLGDSSGHANSYAGLIDEVAIYNRALTAEEIQQQYQNGLNGKGYWDNIPPVIAAHDDVFAEATSPAGAVVNYVLPTASDNYDASVIVTCTPVSGSTFPLGDTTVRCNAKDAAGNHATQTSFIVHVVDTTLPVPDVASLPTNSDQCSIKITTIPTATDSCDGKIIGTTNDPLQYTNQGAYTIHWTYTDRAGNVSTQNQSVIIKDTTAPTINVSAPECVTYGKGNGNKANKITVTGQDNCSKSVIPQITKVEVFNNGGDLVKGDGIYEISGNTVYVNPNGNGWSVRITVIAADENGNTQTIQITKSLIKC